MMLESFQSTVDVPLGVSVDIMLFGPLCALIITVQDQIGRLERWYCLAVFAPKEKVQIRNRVLAAAPFWQYGQKQL